MRARPFAVRWRETGVLRMLGADHVRPLGDSEFDNRAIAIEGSDDAAVVTRIDQPALLEYCPAMPNGRAMLVIGGGGYVALMAGREGIQVSRWLNALGYHAFVLLHRFPNAQHGPAAPLEDADAALRYLHSRDFRGVGVIGLSSGGHLAASMVAARPTGWPLMVSRAPDVMVIGYAPISTNAKGRTIVADKPPLQPPEKQVLYDAMQPDAQLMPAPPPAFLVYAGNDRVVPVENARRLHRAWLAAGSTAELHVFADAPHGFALDSDGPVAIWPKLCEAWLRQVDFL